ncbi:MAG: hypothetical protein LC754_09675 [Acidobacteria bacterium]|nr:hypothetical protein [Acidobacteriota bacterium]
MAKNESRRLKSSDLAADREIYDAVKGIANYAPANPAYTLMALDAAHKDLQTALENETQAEAALATARDNAVAASWKFHNAILGVKDQVTAQFGPDSNEVQAVKLKKKSEYKTRTRKAKNTPPQK